MANRIRPTSNVVAENQQFVLEIEIDAEEDEVTWLIVDDEGTIIEGAEVLQGTGLTEDLELSFVGAEALRPGGYQLQLLRGAIQLDDQDAVDDAEVIAQDSFAVVSSPQGTSRIPDPVNVRLVRQGDPQDPVDDNQFVTFAGFADFLAADAVFQGIDEFPTFGPGNYEALLDAARRFVRASVVTDFDDLVPPGYEADRQAAEPLFPPLNFTGDFRVLPSVELIWNYWEEEASLVQTLNVILARFQNRRLPGRDPLARFDVTPLLPLRNLLWGFAEGEVHRTTVRRRAAEYEYEYGLPLIGRAVPARSRNVERRSAFLESFHQVIHEAHVFFKEADDLTVAADAFPLSRALRDCHLVLSQGSQNQYGEMAVAARAEFLAMQSILAEPPMREFLGGRPMTPYPEPWMDRVDAMKSIQGWDDASVMHYHDLATIGEQLVLTIRLGNWAAPGIGALQAQNWANAFRPALQRYAAAYRSVTAVDLTRDANAEMPATLIARKLGGQRRRA